MVINVVIRFTFAKVMIKHQVSCILTQRVEYSRLIADVYHNDLMTVLPALRYA